MSCGMGKVLAVRMAFGVAMMVLGVLMMQSTVVFTVGHFGIVLIVFGLAVTVLAEYEEEVRSK